MDRQYIATTDKNFKERWYYSPYDEKHKNFLNEFIQIELALSQDHNVADLLNRLEERFLAEHIVIGSAARIMLFDATYDFLRTNDLWAESFVEAAPVEAEPETVDA